MGGGTFKPPAPPGPSQCSQTEAGRSFESEVCLVHRMRLCVQKKKGGGVLERCLCEYSYLTQCAKPEDLSSIPATHVVE